MIISLFLGGRGSMSSDLTETRETFIRRLPQPCLEGLRTLQYLA